MAASPRDVFSQQLLQLLSFFFNFFFNFILISILIVNQSCELLSVWTPLVLPCNLFPSAQEVLVVSARAVVNKR